MQREFRTALFGYNKLDVDEKLAKLKREHEDALALKLERFVEIRDKYNIMNVELNEYKRREQEISAALIKAHTMATEIVKEGERDAETEKARLTEEITQLDRLAHSLYDRIENSILMARGCVEGFEQDLNELITRKEAFLKTTYGFEKEETKESGWKIKI